MNFEVLGTTTWSNVHIGGLLVCIRCCDVIAYVRENLRYDSFEMSANHRLGLKRGQMPPGAQQVLELAAPRDQWEAIAEVVAQADQLKRPVVRNARFSLRWASEQFGR